MEIKSLAQTDLSLLVDCLVRSFEGYFVKMPDDVNYWKNRFKGARVDFNLSFGVFQQESEEEQLVAFMVIGVDMKNGKKTAFNTGTGVLPEFRGRKLVDQLYDFAFPIYKEAGIEVCELEVIQDNGRAIRVYERIGFKIERKLNCYSGKIQVGEELKSKVQIEKINLKEITTQVNPNHSLYSWDNCNEAVSASKNIYATYGVKNETRAIGFFIINVTNGYVAQMESSEEDFESLMAGIAQVCLEIRVNNVDATRTQRLENMLRCGLTNTINQYEMVLRLNHQ